MKNTTRLMLFNVLLVAVALASATGLFLTEIHHESKKWAIQDQEKHLKTFWGLLRNKGKNMRIVDGKLMADDYVVNGNFELPDKIHEIFGCTATIFMGDTRVSTTIRKPDDSRAVETKLQQGTAYDAIFKEGRPYRGEALILGIPYLTAYDPIKNQKGEVIGVLYVGVRESTYFATYEKLRNKVIVVAALMMFFFSVLAALLIRFRRQAVEVLNESQERLQLQFDEYQDLAVKLDEKQNLLKTLINSIPDLIFYKDLDGKYFGCNRAFEHFAGRTEEELIGLTDFDLFPKEVASFFREMDKQMLDQRMARRNEEWVDYPDGRRILLDTLKTPFYDDCGNCLGLIGISRDISERSQAEDERKRLEALLYQAQKMEAIGQLAGGIAHDFNNILTVITGYSEILLLGMKLDHPLRHHIEQVLASAGRAAELTAGLLAFSRKQLLHTKPLDLGEVAQGLKKMLRRLIPEDIVFKANVAETGLTIMADKGQIEQVIMNLVTNAKDAMPRGGTLSIEVSSADLDDNFCLRHGFGKAGRFACITITDTGHGMDAETCKRIFEPFFTTKEAGKGTGLGMAIIYGIVKQHNGYITVDSEPGKGTVFRIYLPLIDTVAQETGQHIACEPPPGGTETILLAEDDIAIRELHGMILEEAGYTIIEAVDGQDALDKFMKHQTEIAILVSDVIMPKIDGKRLYEEIRKIRPDMKVLLMSGYTNDIFIERGIMENECSFMAKPVMPSDLLKAVRDILDNP